MRQMVYVVKVENKRMDLSISVLNNRLVLLDSIYYYSLG